MPGDDDDRVLTEVSEGQHAARLADHLDAFQAMVEDDQRAHLRDAHGARLIPAESRLWPERHAGMHDLHARVGGAHGLFTDPRPPEDFVRLLNGSVERNIERVRRGGLSTVVFTDPGDVPLIARVCIGVIEYTDDYRRLYRDLPPRLDRMRFEAQRLHETLKSATGMQGGKT